MASHPQTLVIPPLPLVPVVIYPIYTYDKQHPGYITYITSPRTILIHHGLLNFFVYQVLGLLYLAYFYRIQCVNIQHQ